MEGYLYPGLMVGTCSESHENLGKLKSPKTHILPFLILTFSTAELIIFLILYISKVGLLLFIHCLLLVPLALGSYVEFLV